MVFGWIKKKGTKSEQKTSPPTEKEIGLSEVEGLLNELDNSKFKKLLTQAKFFRKSFESKRKEILKIIKELEKDDLKVDDMDKHLQILVVRGKKLVISTIKKESSTELPQLDSYAGIVSLNNSLNHELKHVGDVLGRQSRVIHIFAKKYATKLKDHLATLNSERDQLQKFIDEYSKFKENLDSIREKKNEYQNSKKNLDETKSRMEDIKNQINNLQNEISASKQKIQELKNKKEYNEFLEIKEKLSSLSDKENQIKNEVNDQFTKISRPLGKYVYISSLDKQQKRLMENLSDNPFDVLTPANKEDIVAILYFVKKGVESGSVSVKDVAKSLSQIDETIAVIDKLIKKREDFFQKKNALEKNLENLDIQKLRNEESILQQNQKNKKDLEDKIQNLEKQIYRLTEFLPRCLSDMEKTLRSISKTKYHIKSS